MSLPLFTLLAAQNEGKPLGGTLENIGGYNPGEEGELAGTSINTLFSNIFGFLTIVAGLAFLIYFIIGGLNWITAGGNTDKVEKAKKTMTDAAIGLIIITITYAIASIVGSVLGFQLLNPAEEIQKLIPAN